VVEEIVFIVEHI